MKADIHPNMNPVIFVDTSTGEEFVTTSTLTSEEKKKINGIDHFIIKVEISSASHPFYTGKRKLVDTAGRVDKFLERAKKAQSLQAKKVKVVDEELDEILHKDEEDTPKKEEAAKAKKEVKAEKKEKAAEPEAPKKETPETNDNAKEESNDEKPEEGEKESA